MSKQKFYCRVKVFVGFWTVTSAVSPPFLIGCEVTAVGLDQALLDFIDLPL